MPLIPTSSAIGTLLGGISGSVISVWSYDATAQSWTSWNPVTGGLTALVDGKGYWINMSAPATLTVTGLELPAPPAVPPTYAVVTGWNLLGFKSITARANSAYLTGTDYRFPIYGFSAGAYTTISSGAADFQPGHGYWVYFNASGIITP